MIYDEILVSLLRDVPESRPFVEEMYEIPPGGEVPVEDSSLDIYEILAECFVGPVLLPELRKSRPEAALLERCFGFVEKVIEIPGDVPRGAIYFQVLEPLMESESVLRNAFPFLGGAVRERTVRMLHEFGVDWSG
jgi:hypothetical protein